ncbi:MAG: SCO family protein [Deltaproteobacteria bacterium]|nr:SCO family protein [Deltaproteobacteria bacterium]MBW2393368.1 SCO family protein [Deltaproteobacteria bacterium]
MLSAPLPRPEFTLTDTVGAPYAFADRTSGSLTLLFFGYTSCPDVCPNHLSQLAEARRLLADEDPSLADAVKVVFVTVDPPRDTPAHVERWLAHFDSSFVGLVGDEASLRAAQEAAFVPTAERDVDGADADYTVSHAAYVLAYTPDDQAHLRYGISTRAEDWVHDLRILARDGWPGP